MKHDKCPICNSISNNNNNNNNNNKNKQNLWKWLVILLIIGAVLLAIGVLGFYVYHQPNWSDAVYNATAILSGVGAADNPNAVPAQIFASVYTMVVGFFYLIVLSSFIGIALRRINFFITH